MGVRHFLLADNGVSNPRLQLRVNAKGDKPVSDPVTIYHNPRCSKSRQTLELLRRHGIEPIIVNYLESPPSAARIKELVTMLGIAAHDVLRTKEAPYKKLGLSPETSEDDIANAIAAQPILLERPIVACGSKAAIGRPPENVLSIVPR
jgi:arsenate reductase